MSNLVNGCRCEFYHRSDRPTESLFLSGYQRHAPKASLHPPRTVKRITMRACTSCRSQRRRVSSVPAKLEHPPSRHASLIVQAQFLISELVPSVTSPSRNASSASGPSANALATPTTERAPSSTSTPRTCSRPGKRPCSARPLPKASRKT